MINRIFGENFPYTNFHDLNLDWIIQTIKTLADEVEKRTTAKINIADPLQWDIDSQYPELTVVMDHGSAYLAVQAVPYGVNISNTDYWEKIFDVEEVFSTLKNAISFNDDEYSTTASENRDIGSLVWLQDKLKLVTEAINAGDRYTEQNTEDTSIEEVINNLTINTNRLRGKRVAIYGDSYSVAPIGPLWQNIISDVTGIPVHVNAQGSLPLPSIYANLWDNYSADIYIIEGGLNDVAHNTTGNAFMSAIENFVTAIRTVNSNAEIYFVSPNDIPFSGAHDYLYPQEFYRQCYWHLMSRFGFGVIDGLKWQGLKYSDGTHPTLTTAPLIGTYMIASLLQFGDAINFRDDYSKAGRNNTQILFRVENGQPSLYIQRLPYTVASADGTGSEDISNLGCKVQIRRTPFLNKEEFVYTNGFIYIGGEGTTQSPTTLIYGLVGAEQGATGIIQNGYSVPFIPDKWTKDL